ncbi:MAG: hypothetical protein AVDCRST_MAG01-01-3868, partial [uncultured Rubrobacteraceae bacterium]
EGCGDGQEPLLRCRCGGGGREGAASRAFARRVQVLRLALARRRDRLRAHEWRPLRRRAVATRGRRRAGTALRDRRLARLLRWDLAGGVGPDLPPRPPGPRQGALHDLDDKRDGDDQGDLEDLDVPGGLRHRAGRGLRGAASWMGAGRLPGGGAGRVLGDLVLVRPAPAAPGGRRRRERLCQGRVAGPLAGGTACGRSRSGGGRGGGVRDLAEGIPGRLRDSLHRSLPGGLDRGIPEHGGRHPGHGGAARALADDRDPQPPPPGALRRAPARLPRNALPDALPGRHRVVRAGPRRPLRAWRQPSAAARQPPARLRPRRLALVADAGPRCAPEPRRPHGAESGRRARLPERPDPSPPRRLRASGGLRLLRRPLRADLRRAALRRRGRGYRRGPGRCGVRRPTDDRVRR